jgi:hypothetical protein
MRDAERLQWLIKTEVEARFQYAVFRRAIDAQARRAVPVPDGWSFAVDYALHVGAAVREFADLLTQAETARKGRITPKARKVILDEALEFASALTSWKGMAGTFVATSLGIIGGSPANRVKRFSRIGFEKEVAQFNWAVHANNAITLRSLLSARSSPLVSSPALTEELVTKALVARIKKDNLGISQQDICANMDAKGTPTLKRWRRPDDSTWVGAYRRHKTAVKTFLSKIKPPPLSKRPSSSRPPGLPLGSQ